MKKIKLGVLASGKGSNLEAIINAIEKKELDAEIACVISDVENAFALETAGRRNIKAVYIPPGHFKTILTPEAERKYIDTLNKNKVDLVILAGFMRVIKKEFLKAFKDRILNIHPSLLPAFPGMESWKQAIQYGVKVTGVTVHFVDAGIDSGPVILQETVPVLDNDTPETLHRRIQEKEHVLFPMAIKLYAQGRLKTAGRRVIKK
jgi:phosphoribosylglycinamide formyltransferase-1